MKKCEMIAGKKKQDKDKRTYTPALLKLETPLKDANCAFARML
jgi:hypothetical protein